MSKSQLSRSQLARIKARRRKQSAVLDDVASGKVASTISLCTPLSLRPGPDLILACLSNRSAIATAIRDCWISTFPTVTTMDATDLDRCSLVFSAS